MIPRKMHLKSKVRSEGRKISKGMGVGFCGNVMAEKFLLDNSTPLSEVTCENCLRRMGTSHQFKLEEKLED